MSEFDEWFESHAKSVFKNKQGCFDGGYKLGSKMGYKAGVQSQQAKIDELQARIDEIVDLVCNNTPDYYLDNMIEEIIKGNKDEK